jgi:hypothetical protein
LNQLATFTAILTIELDAPLPAGATTPIDREAAMGLAQAVGSDLASLSPTAAECALVLPGALYDQTEVLRPGFPILDALESIHGAGLSESNGFTPGIVALGAQRGQRFPIAVLNPGDSAWRGPLLLIPALLVAPPPLIDSLAEALEPRLLHQGIASAATRDALTRHFGIRPVHVSYATIADLCALLNVQLENAGLLPLWELLQHAFVERSGPLEVELPEGNRFRLQNRAVTSTFLSLASWGEAREGSARTRLQGYLRWTRRQRQYAAALGSYGLVVQLVAEQEAPNDGAEWFRHTSLDRSDTRQRPAELVVTEHAHPELGIIAFSADLRAEDDTFLRRDNYYPLHPQALQALLDHLQALAEAAGIPLRALRPGGVTLSATDGDLTAADAAQIELVAGSSLDR